MAPVQGGCYGSRMHRLAGILLVALLSANAFAQGQVNFSNYVPAANPPVIAPITSWQLGRPGLGAFSGFKAQLFLVEAGNRRSAIGDVTTFRQSPPAAQPYLNAITVIVPGIDVGGSATFVVRVWEGVTYESSLFYGESIPVTITLGGGTSVPADLTGLQPMAILIPEPSTLAFAALGAAVLLLRRRRRPNHLARSRRNDACGG